MKNNYNKILELNMLKKRIVCEENLQLRNKKLLPFILIILIIIMVVLYFSKDMFVQTICSSLLIPFYLWLYQSSIELFTNSNNTFDKKLLFLEKSRDIKLNKDLQEFRDKIIKEDCN